MVTQCKRVKHCIYTDQVKINTYLCEYDFTRFNIFPFKMTELSQIIFENNKTIGDLKDHIIEQNMTKLKKSIDADDLLIRENVLDKPGKVR